MMMPPKPVNPENNPYWDYKYDQPAKSICTKCGTKWYFPPSESYPGYNAYYYVCETPGCHVAGDAGTIKPIEEGVSVPKVVKSALCYGCKVAVCDKCMKCEEASCLLVGKYITSRLQMVAAGLSLPKTQKALGFTQLAGFGLPIPNPYVIVSEEEDLATVNEYDAFIRPCPETPRHGFVESKALKSNAANVRMMWDAARAADPKAELIICKAINASHNAIITPAMLSIGPGNDGATGGHDTISMPLMGVLPYELRDTVKLMKAGVDVEKHDPYLELVKQVGYNNWIYTQIRSGPKVPKAPDFVPERIRVEKVIEASGDLLEWERQIATIERGTVVYHLGGSIISHYGVHCITNRVPILTTRIPVVGEILEPIGEVVQHEPWQMIKGLALGAMMPMDATSMANLLPLMMTTLHNAPAMGNGAGMWVGFAATVMLRAGMAASHGEARHANQDGKASRGTIYELSFKDFFGSRETLGIAQHEFLFYSWPSKGFGGPKWASCTKSLFDLDEGIRALLNDPVEANRVKVVNALNVAVNQAHNGGWWLNKFVQKEIFNLAAKQALSALLSTMNAMLTVDKYAKGIKEEGWKEVATKWKDAGEIIIKSKEGIVDTDVKIDILTEESVLPDIDYDLEAEIEPESVDTSIGIDPFCCGDCKENYLIAAAKKAKKNYLAAEKENEKAKEYTFIVIDPPIVNQAVKLNIPAKPAPTTVATYKAKKWGFDSTLGIEKAHVRFSAENSETFSAHIQCLLVGNRYWSFDYYIKAPSIVKVLKEAGSLKEHFEVSYSSDAKGYLPMSAVKMDSGWALDEPLTGINFTLSSEGELEDATLEGDADESKVEKQEEELVPF